MEEIVPHVFHWTAFHPDIHQEVHSYCFTGLGPVVLIDPMVPREGLDWFRSQALPEDIYLTNRLHYRDCNAFREAFGTTVRCHKAGLHEFGTNERVLGFEHGETLPGGIRALKVDALTPEETAFLIPLGDGALALGDAVIRENDHLEFVPDSLMGDDPEAVKRGLKAAFTSLLEYHFDTLLLAHGHPFVKGGRKALLEVAGQRASAHHR